MDNTEALRLARFEALRLARETIMAETWHKDPKNVYGPDAIIEIAEKYYDFLKASQK